jgi:transcriptional regulator with XRE-family HTH domain
LENKFSNLKQELTELLSNFDAKNNRYSNLGFFKGPIGTGGCVGGTIGSTSSAIGGILGAVIGKIATSKINILEKELERKQKNEKFNIYLQRLIAEKDLSNSDVIKMANMDKSYFYQIIRGEKFPSKDRIIQIAVALNLNIEETNKLLGMQGYVLYGENPRDFIILFCIENRLDLMNVNYMLEEFKQKSLAAAS